MPATFIWSCLEFIFVISLKTLFCRTLRTLASQPKGCLRLRDHPQVIPALQVTKTQILGYHHTLNYLTKKQICRYHHTLNYSTKTQICRYHHTPNYLRKKQLGRFHHHTLNYSTKAQILWYHHILNYSTRHKYADIITPLTTQQGTNMPISSHP